MIVLKPVIIVYTFLHTTFKNHNLWFYVQTCAGENVNKIVEKAAKAAPQTAVICTSARGQSERMETHSVGCNLVPH